MENTQCNIFIIFYFLKYYYFTNEYKQIKACKCKITFIKSIKKLFKLPLFISINGGNHKYLNLDDIIYNNIIGFNDLCRNSKCSTYYNYKMTYISDFLFIIFDYLFINIKKKNIIKIKEKFILSIIECFENFYDLIGFILMPSNNHYTNIIFSNISCNNFYDFYFYDGISNNGRVLKKRML